MLTLGFHAAVFATLVSLRMLMPGIADVAQGASPSVGSASAIGGLWKGTMTDASGERGENTFRFSSRGYPVYGYNDSRGYKEVELTTAGQVIEYVPKGGGVIAIRVRQATGSATRAGYVIDWSFQRASNGYMDQDYKQITMQCELRGGKLAVVYEEAGTNRFGDSTLSVGGPATTHREGLLERVRE